MSKVEFDSVKIYFIDPIEIISVIISTLVEIEFESYIINSLDQDKLPHILTPDARHVIFLCIKNAKEVDSYYEYVEKIKKLDNIQVLIGAFVFEKMTYAQQEKFLLENVAMIKFSELKGNTLPILKRILMLFEAKGKRGYIRTRTHGVSEAYFNFPDRKEPVIGKVKFISAYAVVCEVEPIYKSMFFINNVYNDILLVLNGTRISTSLRFIGFSRDNPNIYMFKYSSSKIESNKMITHDLIAPEMKRKIHSYIKWCLKQNIKIQLDKIDENGNPIKDNEVD